MLLAGAELVDAIDRQELSPSGVAPHGAPLGGKDAGCLTAAASSTLTQLPDLMDAPLVAQPTARCLHLGDALPHAEEPDRTERLSFASGASLNDAASLA